MKQKGIAMALAAVLVAGSLPVSATAAQFRDLNDTPWAAQTITDVANKGLISGYEDGTFRGKNGVTYCETTTMLHNVLTKANALESIPVNSFSMYQPVMNNYKIPQWAQYGVTYCLGAQILTPVELTKFVKDGKSMPADRQGVAMLFGKALAKKYNVNAAQDAKVYKDAHVIAKEALPYINLLTKLGILNGDENNKFNPYNQITRAEMAVIMNKTYDLLTDEMANGGTITEIRNHDGNYYDINVEMASGERKKLSLSDDTISVLTKSGKELPISSLSVGDKVSLVFNGLILEKIYLLNDEADTQKKYDMTGYVVSINGNEVKFESENTGDISTYELDSSCTYYQDGKKSTKADFKKAVEDNSTSYIYAGVMTRTEQKRKDSGKLENVVYITSIDIRIQDEHTTTGKLKYIKDNALAYQIGGNNDHVVSFAKGCKYYIGEKESDLKDLQKMADSGDVYVKVTCNADQKATKVVMAEDTFTDKKNTKTYTVKALTEDEIRVYHGGNVVTYDIASVDDITYYLWESGKWESCSFKKAESFFDHTDGDVYARINLNNKGKISDIYLVDEDSRKAAFDEAEETERKGTVASIKDRKLKFETSGITYKLRDKYKTTSPDQTLTIGGALTQSLTVLERMANCDDVKLYAEIKADIDNEITEIEARLTEATGRIVEYDYDEKELTIKTSDGSEFRLETRKNPDTGTDDYEAKDLGTTGYVGSEVKLSFDSNGVVDKMVVTDHTNGIGFKRVKGTATADGDHIEIDGKTYRTSSKTNISSKSFSYKSIYTIRDLLADSQLEVYAEASIDEKDYVENLSLKMKDATGVFQSYDTGGVQIKTDKGEYVFNTVSKSELAKACGVSDVDDLNDWKGKKVTLVYNSDGLVSEIEK